MHICGSQATLGSQFFLSTSRWPQLGRFEERKNENLFISNAIFSGKRWQLLTGFPFLPGILGSVNYDEETDNEEEEGDSLSSPSAHSEKESSVASQKAASVRGAESVIILKHGELFTPRLVML